MPLNLAKDILLNRIQSPLGESPHTFTGQCQDGFAFQMESRRESCFDHLSQGIDIVIRDPTIEAEHPRVDQGDLIEEVFDVEQFSLDAFRRMIQKVQCETRDLPPFERNEDPHPNLKRVFHFLGNAIVEGLRDGKANGHFNDLFHRSHVIFFGPVCQTHILLKSRFTPTFQTTIISTVIGERLCRVGVVTSTVLHELFEEN